MPQEVRRLPLPGGTGEVHRVRNAQDAHRLLQRPERKGLRDASSVTKRRGNLAGRRRKQRSPLRLRVSV